jgi:Domain of unknown function (DUF4136)
MKWIAYALLGAVTACNHGVSQQEPKVAAQTVVSPHASLAAYKTFSFGLSDQPKTGYEVTARSLEVQRRLRSVLQTALERRGYVLSETKGDFIIKLAAGTGPEAFHDDSGRHRGVDGAELNDELGAERATPTGLARGYIGINIYDGSTGTAVWQGSAFAEIDPAKIDDSMLAMGVSHMLQDFPARDSGSVAAAP